MANPTTLTPDLFYDSIIKFVAQAKTSDLTTKQYPKEFDGTRVKVSFGQGTRAKNPWMAFLLSDNEMMSGIYPGIAVNQELGILTLCYSVSMTHPPKYNWPEEYKKNPISKYYKDNYNYDDKQIFEYSYLAKKYSLDDIPESIIEDLKEVIAQYKEVVANAEKSVAETKYWIISAGRDGSMQSDFVNQSIVAIGWDEMGDLSKYPDRETLKASLIEQYGSDTSFKNTLLCLEEFRDVMKPGDKVFIKSGKYNITGYCEIVGEYCFDKSASTYRNRRKIKWLKQGDWDLRKFRDIGIQNFAIKTLVDITKYKGFPEILLEMIIGKNVMNSTQSTEKLALNTILYGPPGTGKTFQSKRIASKLLSGQVGQASRIEQISEIVVDLSWKEIIMLVMYLVDKDNGYKISDLRDNEVMTAYAAMKNSQNHGATITTTILENAKAGDTTLAEKYRRDQEFFTKDHEFKTWSLTEDGIDFIESALLEEVDALTNIKIENKSWQDYYEFITFHQSYSYEEFIEGIRPRTDDEGRIIYEVADGVFKRLCKKASNDIEHKYLLIIDEINRGNISKIFGELITLLEADKRQGAANEITTTLPYSGEPFSVPVNIYVLGTMNTADRSIALLDIALRRRFKFVELMPNKELLGEIIIDGLAIADLLEKLNDRIEVMIDRDHMIGHSYFMKIDSSAALKEVWDNDIVPLLVEYFYGDWSRLEALLGKYRKDGTGFVEIADEEDIKARFSDSNAADEYLDASVGKIHNYDATSLTEALKRL